MLSLLRTKTPAAATSPGPVGRQPDEQALGQPSVNLEPDDGLPRLPALARIVEEGERTSTERENSGTPRRSVSERIQRLYAFD